VEALEAITKQVQVKGLPPKWVAEPAGPRADVAGSLRKKKGRQGWKFLLGKRGKLFHSMPTGERYLNAPVWIEKNLDKASAITR